MVNRRSDTDTRWAGLRTRRRATDQDANTDGDCNAHALGTTGDQHPDDNEYADHSDPHVYWHTRNTYLDSHSSYGNRHADALSNAPHVHTNRLADRHTYANPHPNPYT